MNNQSLQVLRNILEALMTISVKGNDVFTLNNCMQALEQVIRSGEQIAAAAKVAQQVPEDVE